MPIERDDFVPPEDVHEPSWIIRSSQTELVPLADSMRRHDPRLPLRLSVRVGSVAGVPCAHDAHTVDVSRQGMRLRLAAAIPAGSKIEFIATAHARKVRGTGEVKWLRRHESEYDVGVFLRTAGAGWSELIMSGHDAAEARRRTEMETAREVYDQLLPRCFPALDEIDLHAAIVPAGTVGGDYFDVLQPPGGRLLLTIADVAGKGVPAAISVAAFRAFLRAVIESERSPASLAARLNGLLVNALPDEQFITAVLAEVDCAAGILRYVNAGHPPGVLVRDHRCFGLEGSAPALGMQEGVKYVENRLLLQPGDRAVWFTDGVTEAVDARGRFYDRPRLTDLALRCDELDAPGICAAVLGDVMKFVGGPDAVTDDTTVLAAVWRGPTPATPGALDRD
jgi:hypothetical protein